MTDGERMRDKVTEVVGLQKDAATQRASTENERSYHLNRERHPSPRQGRATVATGGVRTEVQPKFVRNPWFSNERKEPRRQERTE